MGALKRRGSPTDPNRAAVNGVIPIGDGKFTDKHPTLVEFLTRVVWEDGSPREKGSVFVFIEDGMVKACLNDKDSLQVAFVSSVTFAGLWEALEKGLRDDTLDWRVSSQGKSKRSK